MNSRDMKPENSRSDSQRDEQERVWNATWNMTDSQANWSLSRLLVTGAFLKFKNAICINSNPHYGLLIFNENNEVKEHL